MHVPLSIVGQYCAVWFVIGSCVILMGFATMMLDDELMVWSRRPSRPRFVMISVEGRYLSEMFRKTSEVQGLTSL